MATRMLDQEMAAICELKGTYDHLTLLGAFQAYLIYVMTLYFMLDEGQDIDLRQRITKLQELACDTCSRGLVCTAEVAETRPQWPSWIIAESTRRSLYIMYLFDNLLCVEDNIPVYVGTELKGLPAPAGKPLWRATDGESFKAAYNLHLADWNGSGLAIDELWRSSEDVTLEMLVSRRERIDRWLESVDEYGVFLYAVTSCTHGP